MTTNSEAKYLVNPTVLLVDDNVDALTKVARNFTSHTPLGVLPVTNLQDAASYLTNKQMSRYHLKSIFADQEFPENAQTTTLHNGIDLLELASKRQPQIALYLHTVHGEDSALLKRAEISLGSRSRVFPKGKARQPGQEPWNCVWRDWLVEALRTEPSLQEALEHDKINALEALEESTAGEKNMAEKLRRLFDAHRITYLFAMGTMGKSKKLSFKRPIEVVCIREGNGSYRARALGLGVFKEGIDDTDAWEAQMALADHIVDHYLDLKATKSEHLGKFAGKLWSNLKEFIHDPADS